MQDLLEGSITEQQLDNFRQEIDGNGLSSYPHPWLDARVLAISHSFNGLRSNNGNISSPYYEIP